MLKFCYISFILPKDKLKVTRKKCNDLDLCDTRYDYAKNMPII